MSDFIKQCEAFCGEISQIIATRSFAVSCSHGFVVHALWNLIPCFCGNTEILLVVALDLRRRDALKKAIERAVSPDLKLDIQVTTPCILDQIMSQNEAQYVEMMKKCRQMIVWCHPDDFRDNGFEYWQSVFHRIPNHRDIDVGYFGGSWMRTVDLEKYHPNLVRFSDASCAKPAKTRIFYWDLEQSETVPRALWACADGHRTLVSCRDESLRRRYCESLHRAHLHECIDERIPPATSQYVAAEGAYAFDLPPVFWSHSVVVNPTEEDDAFDGGPVKDALQSFLVTSRQAFLVACARCVQKEKIPTKNRAQWAREVATLFSSLGHVHKRQLRPEQKALIDFWEKSGLVTSDDMPTPTDACARLYPGIRCFSQFGVLQAFHHKVRCETANHERMGWIASDFLQHHEFFHLQDHDFQRHYFNALDGVAIVRMQPPRRHPVWIDREPETHSPQFARLCWKLVSGQIAVPDDCLDDSARNLYRQLLEEFSTLPAPNVLEIAPPNAHWWTFAGAHHNAFLCQLLALLEPHLECDYGNDYLRITAPTLTPQKFESSLREVVDRIADFCQTSGDERDTPQNAEIRQTLCTSWKQLHLFHWIFPLIDPEHLSAIFDADCREQARLFERPQCLAVASLHQLDPCADVQRETQRPKTIPNPKEMTMETPKTRITPIERGDGTQIMHTRYPWSYIDNDRQLARALDVILKQPYIGLDVETTLYDQHLCLIQIGCDTQTFLIDPLAVDFSDLAHVFTHPNIVKIIHNAQFETGVLKKYGMAIQNITDTMKVSRQRYGTKYPGGHSLKAVCLREFGFLMDKTNQTSRWENRPLTPEQLEYAALDAEIMIHLYRHFGLDKSLNVT